MEKNRLTASGLIERIAFVLLFSAIGLLIVAVFSPYRPMLSKVGDFFGRIILSAILIIAAIYARKSVYLKKYYPVLFGLFTLIVAVSLVWIIATYILNYLGLEIDNPTGFSLLKLGECIFAVTIVLLFTKLSGFSFSSIYIQKGNLKKGLITGAVTFIISAVGSVFISPLFFGAEDLTFYKFLSWLPWILIFIFSNALTEELLYRGLFLRKLESLYGKSISNLIIALVFTGLHVGVIYPNNQMMFLLLLIPLALVWGYITQKSESLLASVLFHAGTDVAVILGIFSGMG